MRWVDASDWGGRTVDYAHNESMAGHAPPQPYVWRDRDFEAALARVVEAWPCEATLELGTAPTQAVARGRKAAGERKRKTPRTYLTRTRRK